jgi:predicted lipoprotein with Yx(FWY)xxD motif
MRFMKISLALTAASIMAFLLAGCGSSNGNGGGAYGSTTANPTATATTATTGPSQLPINTASVSASGKTKTVLVNAQGLTLYYHTPDTATSVWTDAATWPPLLAPSGAPTSTASLSGTLAIQNDANGAQVTYNGHPLYTYAGDSGPGMATGDGLGGVWFVATPGLAQSTAVSGATPTPSGSGYGQ